MDKDTNDKKRASTDLQDRLGGLLAAALEDAERFLLHKEGNGSHTLPHPE
jgi:hypothetical protein